MLGSGDRSSARADANPVPVEQNEPCLTVTDEHGLEHKFPCEACHQCWNDIHPGKNLGLPRDLEKILNFIEIKLLRFEREESTIKKKLKLIKIFLQGNHIGRSVNSEAVSVGQFISLIKRFGCVRTSSDQPKCYLLQQIDRILIHARDKDPNGKTYSYWLAVPMNKVDACDRLSGEPVGTFLVRFSDTYDKEGGFVISVKAEQQVDEYIVLGNPEEMCKNKAKYNNQLRLKATNEEGEDIIEDEAYPDIIDFVRERCRKKSLDGVRCKRICPKLPLNNEFRGYK